jgi:hypothetical protein
MNIETFIQRANAYFGLVLTSPIRKREYVDARNMAINYIRENSTHPLTIIGKHFNRDHSTIIHSIERHDDLMSYDKSYQRSYKQFCDTMRKDGSELVISVSDDVMVELTKMAADRNCSVSEAAALFLTKIKYTKIRAKEYRKYTKKDYEKVMQYKGKGVTRRKIAHKLGWTIQQVQYVTDKLNHGKGNFN